MEKILIVVFVIFLICLFLFVPRRESNFPNIALPLTPVTRQLSGTCWATAPVNAIQITFLAQRGQAIPIDIQSLIQTVGITKPDDHISGSSEASFEYFKQKNLISDYVRISPSSSAFEQQLYTLLATGTALVVHINDSSTPEFRHLTANQAHLDSTLASSDKS